MRLRASWLPLFLALATVPAACGVSLPVDGERMLARVRHHLLAHGTLGIVGINE